MTKSRVIENSMIMKNIMDSGSAFILLVIIPPPPPIEVLSPNGHPTPQKRTCCL